MKKIVLFLFLLFPLSTYAYTSNDVINTSFTLNSTDYTLTIPTGKDLILTWIHWLEGQWTEYMTIYDDTELVFNWDFEFPVDVFLLIKDELIIMNNNTPISDIEVSIRGYYINEGDGIDTITIEWAFNDFFLILETTLQSEGSFKIISLTAIWGIVIWLLLATIKEGFLIWYNFSIKNFGWKK